MSWSLRLPLRPRGGPPHGTDYVHVTDTPQDALLYGEPHHPMCADIFSKRVCVLSTSRRGGEDDHVHIHPLGLSRVSLAGV